MQDAHMYMRSNEKDLDTSRETENKNSLPLAVTIRQFLPRNAKIGLSPPNFKPK